VRFIYVLYVLHCLLVINIQDGLKNAATSNMISRIRNLAVEFRTPLKSSEKLKKAGLRMAILDQDTRDEAAHILCGTYPRSLSTILLSFTTGGYSSQLRSGGRHRNCKTYRKAIWSPRSSSLMTSLLVIFAAKWTGLRRMFS
jgi:hypothetical protein